MLTRSSFNQIITVHSFYVKCSVFFKSSNMEMGQRYTVQNSRYQHKKKSRISQNLRLHLMNFELIFFDSQSHHSFVKSLISGTHCTGTMYTCTHVSMNSGFKGVPGQDLAGNLWLRAFNVRQARRSVRFQVESLKVVQTRRGFRLRQSEEPRCTRSRVHEALGRCGAALETFKLRLYIGDVSARELHSRQSVAFRASFQADRQSRGGTWSSSSVRFSTELVAYWRGSNSFLNE